MRAAKDIGLPEALERAAGALRGDADAIRPANGDPFALLSLLDAEASQRVLEWLLVNQPAAGCELVDAWLDAGPEAAQRLARLDASRLPKQSSKALRRAHHRLRSRGESLPEPSVPPVVATLPKLADEIETALVSGLDPRGSRMAYLAENDPSGGVRLFAIAIDEDRGVRELEVFSAGRSKIKAFLRDCTRLESDPAVEVPADSLRALVARAAAAQPADRPLPRAFAEWRSRIAKPPAGAATPGALARAALAEPGGAPPAARSRALALLREQRIGPWPPSNDVLAEILRSLDDASSGVLEVSERARREQVERALDAAVERVFSAEFAARTAQRFDETAYVLWKRGALEDAQACLAAADVFRSSRAEFGEMARAMLEVVFAPALEAIAQRRGEPARSVAAAQLEA
jgi:hypothetical protein